MDLFVTSKRTHTFFRAAAVLFGIYVVHAGLKYNDTVLVVIGLLTIVVDAYTFCLSIKSLPATVPATVRTHKNC